MATETADRVRLAAGHWKPRFVANGIDANDFDRVLAETAEWRDWAPNWKRVGDEHRALGEAADRAGHTVTATDAHQRAAWCYHVGKFLWFEDRELHAELSALTVATYAKAMPRIDPPGRRIEAPFEGAVIPGILRTPRGATKGAPLAILVPGLDSVKEELYAMENDFLRRPQGIERAPLAVLLPGLDSTKEEFFEWENVFLARGLATFSLDGPGQGETGYKTYIHPNYEVALTALLDQLQWKEPVGVVGVSLGGYYAPRAAAFEKRIVAAVGVSGAFCFGDVWDARPSLTKETFQHHSGSSSPEEARAKAFDLTLEGVAEQIAQPLLVIAGKLDRLVEWKESKKIADEAPNSTWVLFEEGNHVCNNIPYKYRPAMADWMRERLAA